ncbi:CHAT domain-containing protein [Niveibacterium umoris]|uniref:CHAT domain-containing protein n=1 Tax=Niveibacterium umoris TaxID=1193620 RepID=A0A840BSK0_9RHOO|nr:CHAT domain-containing protein [Niveibacterium umoris]MBB4014652.1 CHAT domain-containing protein [Niveibacterium umoris]
MHIALPLRLFLLTAVLAATPTLASEPTLLELGGLNLDGYCKHLMPDAQAGLQRPAQGEDAARNNWQCVRGETRQLIDFTAACRWQYPAAHAAIPKVKNPDSAYSIVCAQAQAPQENSPSPPPDAARQRRLDDCARRWTQKLPISTEELEACLQDGTQDFADLSNSNSVEWLYYLASRYAEAKRPADQRRMLELCVANAERVLGIAHATTFGCWQDWADMQFDLGDVKGAEKGLRKALAAAQAMGEPGQERARPVELKLKLIAAMASGSEADMAAVMNEALASAKTTQQANERYELVQQMAATLQGKANAPAVGDLMAKAGVITANDDADDIPSLLIRVAGELSALTKPGAPLTPEERERRMRTIEQLAGRARQLVGLDDRQQAQAYAGFAYYLRMLAGMRAEIGDVAEGFRVLEQNKASLLTTRVAQSLALQQSVVSDRQAQALKSAWQQVEAAERERAKLQAGSADHARAQARVIAARQAFAQVREAAVAASPRLASMLEPPVPAQAKVQAALAPDEVWISYLVLADRDAAGEYGLASSSNKQAHLAAFVLSRNEVHFKDLGQIDVLDDLVFQFRLWLSGGSATPSSARAAGVERGAKRPLAWSAESLRASGDRLRTRLIDPLLPWLTGKRLIISPDGPLSQLPFAALPYQRSYLVERYELAFTPNASLWLMQRARPPAPARDATILIGNARYESRATRMSSGDAHDPGATLIWPDLPGTAQEIDAIARIIPSARRFEQARASEMQLRQLDRQGALASSRVLHLAAHGYLDADDPLRSAIVLDLPAATPEYDGLLTAGEMLQMNLNTDLVVLSACNSAVSQNRIGAGPLGLPWALAVAGNRNLIASLWPVNDDATAWMMTALYQHLAKGVRPGEALTAVQRTMLRDPTLKTPLFWAPFILFGS